MPTHICKSCGTIGSPEKASPSSFATELAVWIAAIIIGLLFHWIVIVGAIGFTLWRFIARYRACEKCGSHEVIPINSPIGRQLVDQLKAGEPPTLREKI